MEKDSLFAQKIEDRYTLEVTFIKNKLKSVVIKVLLKDVKDLS